MNSANRRIPSGVSLTSSRIVIVAGAGIGGLTARWRWRATAFASSCWSKPSGSRKPAPASSSRPTPRASLIDLGLGDRLRPHVVAPQAVRVLDGAKRTRNRAHAARRRRRAALWRTVLDRSIAAICKRRSAAAVNADLDISVKLGMRMEDFATHPQRRHGFGARRAAGSWNEHGDALIAADGLWSDSRARIGFNEPPRFAGRTAWRALVPAQDVAPEFREPLIHLWLGRDAHLVHYPVKGGAVINVVVITADTGTATRLERAGKPRRSVARAFPPRAGRRRRTR